MLVLCPVHWADQQLFPIGAMMIPAKALTKEFIDDRVSYGATFIGKVPPEQSKGQLRLHLASIEEQLKANKVNNLGPYFLGTQEPQMIDVAGFYTTLNWIQTIQKSAPEYLPLDSSSSSSTNPFPTVIKYMTLIRNHIQKSQSSILKPRYLEASEAAALITEAGAKATKVFTSKSSNVDEADPLVRAGKLKFGDEVQVTPADTGRVVSPSDYFFYFAEMKTRLISHKLTASSWKIGWLVY